MAFISGKDFGNSAVKLFTWLVNTDQNIYGMVPTESDGTATGLATKLGATNEAAPSSDTASSGINGRLQRVAQHLSTLIAWITGAVSTYHVVTAATTNAANIKASAGTVFQLTGFNGADYPVKVCLHNTSGTPTAGSGVVFSQVVQAGVRLDVTLPRGGRAFATGIGISIVKIAAPSDLADSGATATALNDAQFEVAYV